METVLETIKQVVHSLLQVTNLIANTDDNTSSERVSLLENARTGCFDSILEFGGIFEESTKFCLGEIVVAPRLFSGVICQDLAVLVGISSVCEDHECDEAKLTVAWLRPLSDYELNSTGSHFPMSQVQHNGFRLYCAQKAQLDNIRRGDEVICKLTPHGVWVRCCTLKFTESDGTVEVKPVRLHEREKEANPVTLPLSISRIAPLPKGSRSSNYNSKKLHSSLCEDQIFESDEGNHELTSQGLQVRNSRPGMDAKITVSFDKIAGLGEWERHTKGIGGKLLSKMGYKRGTGLGRQAQGIVVPMESLLKPLPAGLSLDFIHETRATSAGGACEAGAGDASSQLSAAQKRILDIYDADEKKAKKARSAGPPPEREKKKTVFDFLNSMGPGPGASRTSSSSSSSSSTTTTSSTVKKSGGIPVSLAAERNRLANSSKYF